MLTETNTNNRPVVRAIDNDGLAFCELTREDGSKIALTFREGNEVYHFMKETHQMANLEDALESLSVKHGKYRIGAGSPVSLTDEQRTVVMEAALAGYQTRASVGDNWFSHAQLAIMEAYSTLIEADELPA